MPPFIRTFYCGVSGADTWHCCDVHRTKKVMSYRGAIPDNITFRRIMVFAYNPYRRGSLAWYDHLFNSVLTVFLQKIFLCMKMYAIRDEEAEERAKELKVLDEAHLPLLTPTGLRPHFSSFAPVPGTGFTSYRDLIPLVSLADLSPGPDDDDVTAHLTFHETGHRFSLRLALPKPGTMSAPSAFSASSSVATTKATSVTNQEDDELLRAYFANPEATFRARLCAGMPTTPLPEAQRLFDYYGARSQFEIRADNARRAVGRVALALAQDGNEVEEELTVAAAAKPEEVEKKQQEANKAGEPRWIPVKEVFAWATEQVTKHDQEEMKTVVPNHEDEKEVFLGDEEYLLKGWLDEEDEWKEEEEEEEE